MKGIYVLKEDKRVVYIGKSHNDIMVRVLNHTISGAKKFNSVKVLDIDNDSDIAIVEMYLICKFKPKYNRDSKYSDKLSIVVDVDKFWKNPIHLEYFGKRWRLPKSVEDADKIKRIKWIVSSVDDDGLVKEYYGLHKAAKAMSVSSQAISSAIKRNGKCCGVRWKRAKVKYSKNM